MIALAAIDSTFDRVTDLIRTRAGLVFPPTRRKDVEIGTRKVMATAGLADCGEWLGRLERDAALLDNLISELTIRETYFFREPGHFALVRDEIVRELRRLRGAKHVLRVWSAGCASGEEPYSLAILFEEMGRTESIRILATDISRTALTRARQAVYSPWALRGEGARLIGRYLLRSGDRFDLAERFRQRVEFAYLNLAQNDYPTSATNTVGMDLILCRNVLIYFDAKTIRDVAQRFYESLADGGFLITGSADPLLADYAPYEIQITLAGVIYRKPLCPLRRTAIAPATTFVPPFTESVPLASVVARDDLPTVTPFSPFMSQLPTLPADPLAEARQAFARGDNARAIELAGPFKADVAATMLCGLALANLGDVGAAATVMADAAAQHPASPEIGFLLAVLLINLDRHSEADRALRRVLYLDRSLAAVHFTLGATLRRLGDLRESLRAYRNARDLAARRPSGEIMPLSEGEKAGRLAEAAATQVASLEVLVETVI